MYEQVYAFLYHNDKWRKGAYDNMEQIENLSDPEELELFSELNHLNDEEKFKWLRDLTNCRV